VKHLVVLANPKETCFTRDACALYIEELRARGHEVVLRDLYAMNFNPVASADDLRGNMTGAVAADVKVEQDHVLWCDVLTFVHPIWWIDRPAILKGWVDRVMALGFAYGYSPNGPIGKIAGRKAVLITSSGSLQQHWTDSGKEHAMRIAQDVGTMEFCGLEMIRHLHFAPLGSRATAEMVEGYKRQIRDLVREVF